MLALRTLTTQTKRQTAARIALSLALLGLLGLSILTALGFAGRLWWLFDLCSHFRAQYAALLMLCFAVLIALKRWRWSVVTSIALLLNLFPIAKLYWPQASSVNPQRPTLDLVVFNVNFGNPRYSDVANYLLQADVDVIVIVEATPPMRLALEAALPNYQVVGRERTDAFGMLVFSRVPISSHEILYLADTELPAIVVRLEKNGTHFSLLGLHTMPPVDAKHAAMRDGMMQAAAAWARRTETAIIAGDFNATPWSFIFDDLLDHGNLRNSQLGNGLQTTWPGGLWPMSIPIDHCVHDKTLRTAKRFVGPTLGSDHRPLHLRLGFAASM